MKQGELWMADLNPVAGSEQKGIRPVLIISGNSMNDNLGISIICPLTSKVKNYAGCLVLSPDDMNRLELQSEVISFQVRTISHSRLTWKMGVITREQLEQVKKGLEEVLTY